MSTDRRRAPVFILAPPRSYSTVALALLAGHPELYGFPELLLFQVRTAGELLTEAQRRPDLSRRYIEVRQTGPCRAIAQLHEGNQSPAAMSRARAWLEAHAEWPVKRLFDHLLDIVAPRTGLEKSPDTVTAHGALTAGMSAYPDARFLHLTRHPVTSQASMHRHWEYLAPTRARRHLIADAASAWYLGHSRTVDALRKLPSHRWLRVMSEDLLRQPRVWLPKILDWLALTYDATVIDRMLHTERWEYASRGESGDLFGGDAIFMHFPELRSVAAPGPVVFDPAWGLPAEMCRRMTSLAHFLGY